MWFLNIRECFSRKNGSGGMFVQDVVPWRKSRCILFWRLRRLLLENQIKSQMLNIQPNLSVGQAEAMLRRWFVEDKGTTVVSLFCDS